MPSGVSKINHVLSKGTFGYNQKERNKYLQDLLDSIGSQLESDITSLLTTSTPVSGSSFSQNNKTSANKGGSSSTDSSGKPTTSKSTTTEKETIGPQVVFQENTSTRSSNNSTGNTNNSSTSGVTNNSTITATASSNNQAAVTNTSLNSQNLTNNKNTLKDNKIAIIVAGIFKIGGENIKDPIKSVKGYYYVVDNNKLMFFKPNDLVSQFFDLKLVNAVTSKQKNPFSSKLENKNGFTSTSEKYNLFFNIQKIKEFIRNYLPKIYSNPKMLNKLTDVMISEMISYLNKNLFNQQIYDDYSFSYQAPFDSKQIKDTNLGNSLIFNIESEYNFYEDIYEPFTQTTGLNERLFPNLYVYMSDEVQEQKSGYKLNHATLNKRIKLKNIDDEYYYTNWSNTALKIAKPSILDSISFPLLNTIYQKKDFVTLQDKNNGKEYFPMFNKLEFSMTNADMNIAEKLNESAFSVPLYNSISSIIPVASSMESIAGLFNQGQATNPNLTDDVQVLENTITVIEKPGLNDILKSDYSIKNMRVISFDLFNQISSSIENVENYSIPKRKGFNILNYLSEPSDVDDSPIFRIIEPLKIKGEIKNSIETRSRTYVDFIKNTDLSDSETMFYRISKFRITNENNNLIKQYVQSYTVPNFQDITKFIQYDTQLRYDMNYEYMVAAYQIVLGSEYQYVQNKNSTNKNLVFNAVSCPILKLVETPYFTKTVYIKDSPPIEPDVHAVFFKDVSNVVKFIFNSQVSTKYSKPILINGKDGELFEKIKKAQQTKELVKFESEDPPSYFEVFRTQTKPTKYEDFRGRTLFKVLPKFGSYAGDIVDVIIPNTKYYYIFRVADVHQHISNPTQCFEIEIVDDNGKVFPIVNIINLEEEKQENKTKQLKRFLHIKPALVQREIRLKNDDNSSALNNEVILGTESDSLWGKKLKVRVKSKLSNKMVDFNIYFNKQHIISKDEKDLTS